MFTVQAPTRDPTAKKKLIVQICSYFEDVESVALFLCSFLLKIANCQLVLSQLKSIYLIFRFQAVT